MKKLVFIAAAVALLGIFLAYLTTFQVNFDESAILLTFGRASEKNVVNADGRGAGLHFQLPYPIQKVLKFDRRLQVLDDKLEQQETKDKQAVILKAFVVWRIARPLDFYRSFAGAASAERFIKDRLRNAKSEIGNFTFDDLTNTDPEKLKISEAERKILDKMNKDLERQSYGIEFKELGISKIILPEQITASVFSRMRKTRERLAQNARSEGKAISNAIMSKADSDRRRILAFAEREAQNIMAEGDAAAAQYYKVFASNEDFAIFLRKLEALQSTLGENSTFLLDTEIIPFDLLKRLDAYRDIPKNEDGKKNASAKPVPKEEEPEDTSRH